MKHNRTTSLSLQKEMEKRNLSMDSEIYKAFKELKIKSLIRQSNIIKQKGYLTITRLYLVILLPIFSKASYLSLVW